MFDVSFSELMVVVGVALVVIGPEKLPKVARTLGALTGRMQRYMAQVKEEVNREVRFSELQELQNQIKNTVNKTQVQLQAGVEAMTKDAQFEMHAVQSPIDNDVAITDAEVITVADVSKTSDDSLAVPDVPIKKIVRKRVKKPVSDA